MNALAFRALRHYTIPMQRHIALHRRSLVAFLAFIALGLRSVIPIGYMPDASGHGTLVICDGIHHAAMQKQGGGKAPDNHSHGVCPFSIGALYSFAGVGALPPVMFTYITPSTLLPATQALGKQLIDSNHSARAPPFFS